jgi:hypothetical protein
MLIMIKVIATNCRQSSQERRSSAGNNRVDGVVSIHQYCCAMKPRRETPKQTANPITRLSDHGDREPPKAGNRSKPVIMAEKSTKPRKSSLRNRDEMLSAVANVRLGRKNR